MEHIKPQSGGRVASHGEAQHETSDVNIKAIAAFGVFLIISAVVIHLALYGFYLLLDHEMAKQNPPPNPMMKAERTPAMDAETKEETAKRLNRTFGGNALNPMLQVDDAHDMDMMRQAQNAQMNEYRWANQSTGAVTIPIERAMDLIVERGLPNVPMLPPGKAAAQGAAAPGANAPTPSGQTAQPPAAGPKKK